jgi:hypothetical protein
MSKRNAGSCNALQNATSLAISNRSLAVQIAASPPCDRPLKFSLAGLQRGENALFAFEDFH